MKEYVLSYIFEWITEWFMEGGWKTVFLFLFGTAVIWVAIKKAVERLMTPLILVGVALLVIGAWLRPQPQPVVVIERPSQAWEMPELPKIDTAAIREKLGEMWTAFKERVSEVNLSGIVERIVEAVNSVLPRWPSDSELAMRRAEEEARRRAEEEAEAQRRRMLANQQRRAVIRARNNLAKQEILNHLNNGINRLEENRKRRGEEIEQHLWNSMQPPRNAPVPIYRPGW